MLEPELFRTVLEGGAIAVVFYAFYLLLNNMLKGQSRFETALREVQSNFLDALQQMQTHYAELLRAEQHNHREEVQEITDSFSESLDRVTASLTALAQRVGQLDERVQSIAKDFVHAEQHNKDHEARMERLLDRTANFEGREFQRQPHQKRRNSFGQDRQKED